MFRFELARPALLRGELAAPQGLGGLREVAGAADAKSLSWLALRIVGHPARESGPSQAAANFSADMGAVGRGRRHRGPRVFFLVLYGDSS